MVFSVDLVARVLGIVGTAAGVIAALIAALSYRRDRPQLKLTWRLEFMTPSEADLVVDVVNDGRQPLAVRGVEVQNFVTIISWQVRAAARAHVQRWLSRFRWFQPPDQGGHSIQPEPEFSAANVLRPGEARNVRFPASRLREFAAMHRGEQLYIVASDVLGRAKVKPLSTEIMEFVASGRALERPSGATES